MSNSLNVITQASNRGIFRIKLNEPGTYNALSLKTINSLIEILKNLTRIKIQK